MKHMLTGANYYQYISRLGGELWSNPISRILSYIGGNVSPDFMILGAQKAGTTALYSYLTKSPQIVESTRKEVHYFDVDEVFSLKGVNYYHSFFPRKSRFKYLGLKYTIASDQFTFDATPDYLYHPLVAKRIYDYKPKMKFIVVLREPASRAFSGWNMYSMYESHKLYSHQFESRSFEEAINDELETIEDSDWYRDPRGYIKRGVYWKQLRIYFELFDRSQFFLITQKELLESPQDVLDQLTTFVGMKRFLVDAKLVHKREYKSEYPNEIISKLKSFYEPYNRELFDNLGYELNW